jgi:N utilization substance protein A
MHTEFEQALDQLCEEKNLSREEVISAIELALAAAFRKDYGNPGNVVAKFNVKDLSTKMFDVKQVVEVVEDPQKEIDLETALVLKVDAKIGDVIETDITPSDGAVFGRIAAQTAKQVVIQRLREAERTQQFSDFKAKEHSLVVGMVQRIDGDAVIVDLGHGAGLLFPSEQIRGEQYTVGQRLKVLVLHVESGMRGPKITLSRSHPDVVRRLFENEVPEIANGTVEIKSVAREAGSRAKVAVHASAEGVDPVGACVGQKGVRVQTIMAELGGEKLDIIEWSEDPVKMIANSLSPAKILSVQLDEEHKEAVVEVLEDQLSLAIGRSGQNVRLAARLTGWKIDISGKSLAQVGDDNQPGESAEDLDENSDVQDVQTSASEEE